MNIWQMTRSWLSIPKCGDPIIISPLPVDLRNLLESKGCMIPNDCYHNCGKAVSELIPRARYVLCFASFNQSDLVGHAVIKLGRRYYDPTLETQPRLLQRTKCEFVYSLSRTGLKEFMDASYSGKPVNRDGLIEVSYPEFLSNGNIGCAGGN